MGILVVLRPNQSAAIRGVTMCRPATCRSCGKATYAGCGQHVEQVLRGVPQNQRCSCATATTAQRPASERAGGRPLLDRLLRR